MEVMELLHYLRCFDSVADACCSSFLKHVEEVILEAFHQQCSEAYLVVVRLACSACLVACPLPYQEVMSFLARNLMVDLLLHYSIRPSPRPYLAIFTMDD